MAHDPLLYVAFVFIWLNLSRQSEQDWARAGYLGLAVLFLFFSFFPSLVPLG